MSDLREQMLKLGLVSEKQAKAASHKDRVRKKKKGRRGVEADRAARSSEQHARTQEQREQDRSREAARQETVQSKTAGERVAAIVDSGRLTGRTEGRRRWYFERRDGRVSYLEVTEDVQGRLESRQARIAESPEGALTLVDAEAARRVAELDASWLR